MDGIISYEDKILLTWRHSKTPYFWESSITFGPCMFGPVVVEFILGQPLFAI